MIGAVIGAVVALLIFLLARDFVVSLVMGLRFSMQVQKDNPSLTRDEVRRVTTDMRWAEASAKMPYGCGRWCHAQCALPLAASVFHRCHVYRCQGNTAAPATTTDAVIGSGVSGSTSTAVGMESEDAAWQKKPLRVPGDPGRIVLTRCVPHTTKPGVEVEVTLRGPSEPPA